MTNLVMNLTKTTNNNPLPIKQTIANMSNTQFESLNHEWNLEEDGQPWDGEQSVKMTIGGVELAEIFGMDHGGCLDEEDEDYPKMKEDLKFVSRVLVKSKDMYLLLDKIANGVYTPFQREAEILIARINRQQ